MNRARSAQPSAVSHQSNRSWSRFLEAVDETDWKSYAALGVVIATPLVLIGLLSALNINRTNQVSKRAGELTGSLDTNSHLGKITASLARERGISCLFLDTPGAEQRKEVAKTKKRFRDETMRLLHEFFRTSAWTQRASHCMERMYILMQHRAKVEERTDLTCPENLNYYTDLIVCQLAETFKLLSSNEEGYLYAIQHGLVLQQAAQHYQVTEATYWMYYMSQGAVNTRQLFDKFIRPYSVHDQLHSVTQWTSEPAQRKFADSDIELLHEKDTVRDALLYQTEQFSLDEGSLIYCNRMKRHNTELRALSRETSDHLHDLKMNALLYFLFTCLGLLIVVFLCAVMAFAYGLNTYMTMIEVQNVMEIVEEKNTEVVETKERAEQLLYGMLPRSVAQFLKNDQQVPPQTFQCVTICFIQVRRFNQITEGATPMQVVNILNSIYSSIDHGLERYAVYKVETVNDQYMVASGLPELNGDIHSSEICSMLLDIITEMRSFNVEHLKEIPVSAGVNTGSCVAGVIGRRQPRYCLFGDTVNIASRMNSTSLDYHAQMTPEVVKHLEQHHPGMFQVESRGPVEVKGRGIMSTFWLTARELDSGA